MPINREELEALFLSLDEEEFVERVLVSMEGVEKNAHGSRTYSSSSSPST